MVVAIASFQIEPERNQSLDDSEGPSGDPPDDNLGGARVGHSRCLLTPSLMEELVQVILDLKIGP